MLEWLLAPVDPGRAHELNGIVAWHGRLMVLSWGIVLPLGIVLARYFKIWPGQDWPRVLDDRRWWHGHLALQYFGGMLMLAGLALALLEPANQASWQLHGWLGYTVVVLGATQFIAGWLRGTKGGPTEPAPDGSLAGDHFDMTPRRHRFEHYHKRMGYIVLLASWAAIGTGLWLVNAPRWMGLALVGWWFLLALVFVLLQRRGMWVDTYQAIWGPDPGLPGNRS